MKASKLCALSTVSAGGRAHINHMYFAWTGRYEVIWFSDRDSVHSRNLERSSTAAITIYDSHQVNGRPDRASSCSARRWRLMTQRRCAYTREPFAWTQAATRRTSSGRGP